MKHHLSISLEYSHSWRKSIIFKKGNKFCNLPFASLDKKKLSQMGSTGTLKVEFLSHLKGGKNKNNRVAWKVSINLIFSFNISVIESAIFKLRQVYPFREWLFWFYTLVLYLYWYSARTLTLLHSEQPKLYWVLAVLSAIGLRLLIREIKISALNNIQSIQKHKYCINESKEKKYWLILICYICVTLMSFMFL